MGYCFATFCFSFQRKYVPPFICILKCREKTSLWLITDGQQKWRNLELQIYFHSLKEFNLIEKSTGTSSVFDRSTGTLGAWIYCNFFKCRCVRNSENALFGKLIAENSLRIGETSIIENIAVKMEFCGTFNFLQGFRLVINWRRCCTYMLVLNFRGAQAECTDGRRAHQTTCALIQSSVYQSLMLKDPEIKKN